MVVTDEREDAIVSGCKLNNGKYNDDCENDMALDNEK